MNFRLKLNNKGLIDEIIMYKRTPFSSPVIFWLNLESDHPRPLCRVFIK